MRAGRLRHRVQLLSQQSRKNAYNEDEVYYSLVGTYWGAVEPLTGKERFASGERVHEADVRIVMRYVGAITTANVIKHGTTMYDIRAVINKNDIDREYELLCTEGLQRLDLVPYTLTKVSGDNQSGDINVPLPNPMVVRVDDQFGDPYEGATVTWSGGDLDPTSDTSDADGLASSILTPAVDENTITATVTDVTPVTFTATGIGLVPTASESTASVPAGEAGSQTTITVQVRDQNGDPWTEGGDTVVGTVTGANTDTCAVVDNEDGTYTLTYTPAVEGTDSIAITLNGTAIGGSPYSSVVSWVPSTEPGLVIWLRAKLLSSQFQDSAGTTPVTAADQPVGRVNDQSANGDNATQTSDASRPNLALNGGFYEWEGDGAGDYLDFVTNNVTERTVAMVMRSDISSQGIGTWADGNNLMRYISSGTGMHWSVRDPNTVTTHTIAAPLAVGENGVCIGRASTSLIQFEVNGVAGTPIATTALQTQAYQGIMQRAGLQYLDGAVREVVIYDHSLSDSVTAKLRTYLASENGVTL